ncbi:MAG: PEP-CTERM sorting domain-containing protein, partial [Opitutales bacterium]|nr:PEP-CTERM sorting domain-containing protein [Opitutales bacterium]
GESVEETTSTLPSQWNFLCNLNIDVNAASGNKTVFSNPSGKYFNYQLGGITISNSVAASTAKAVVDIGTGTYMLFQGNANGQNPSLTVSTDTQITANRGGGNHELIFFRRSAFAVDNGATLTLDAQTYIYGDAAATGPTVDIASGAAVNFSKNIQFGVYSQSGIYGTMTGSNSAVVNISTGSNGSMTIGADGSITSSGDFNVSNSSVITNNGTMASGAKMTISGGSTITGSGTISAAGNTTINGGASVSVASMNVKKLNLDGTSSLTVAGNFARDNSGTGVAGESTVVVGGNLITGQGQLIAISGASTFTAQTCATLNNLTVSGSGSLFSILSGNTESNRSVTIDNSGVVSFGGDYTMSNNANQTDYSQANATVVTVSTGGQLQVAGGDIYMSTSKLALLTANAVNDGNSGLVNLSVLSNTKRSLLAMSANQTFGTITADTKTLELEISGGAVLAADFASANGGLVFVNGFAEDTVYIGNACEIADVNSIFYAYATKDDESSLIDTLYISDSGFLSAIAPVPEPSTFAAVLGALALAAAVCRRRK